MTSKEKAIETRKKHNEVRRAREQERLEILEKMKITCLNVLDCPSTSSEIKIKAVEILRDLY